jgi:hypothetical protein
LKTNHLATLVSAVCKTLSNFFHLKQFCFALPCVELSKNMD